MMELCSIASGSSGNCIYAGTDHVHLLVDTGISKKKIENGFYLVRQLSGSGEDKYIDFAAVVQVYKDANYEDELFVTMKSGDAVLYSSLDKSKHDSFNVKELKSEEFVLPLIVEISYPADRPYDDREKAYFRFEIYNDNYKLTE